MNDLDALTFADLFKDSFLKCFGYSLSIPLSESESNLFSNEILNKTGLVIGWKSLKNYSYYILNTSSGKTENPSIATLDTLARYVLDAPPTDEIRRKNTENHYPYWFQYKDRFYKSKAKKSPKKIIILGAVFLSGLVLTISLLFFLNFSETSENVSFTENFQTVSNESLLNNGWFVKSKDHTYWDRRDEKPNHLTLFTLKGDNWPDSTGLTGIKNLLLRKIPSGCFTVETHLIGFIPKQNWQQAGILLLEDTSLSGKSLRLSLAYNDFTGGFPSKSRDIIVQAIISQGNNLIKPEEIAHKLVFSVNSDPENLIIENLMNSALRIEKHGKTFRFLFSNGAMKNSAFKEIISRELYIEPKYVGLFAVKGFVDDADNIPASFSFFNLESFPCAK